MIRDVCRRLSHARMRIDLGSMEFSAGHTAAYKEAEDSKLQQELMSIKSAVSVGSSKSNAGGKKPVLGGKKASRGSGSASKGRRDLLSEAIAHGGRVEATPHFKVLYTREQISEKVCIELNPCSFTLISVYGYIKRVLTLSLPILQYFLFPINLLLPSPFPL